MMSIAKVVLSFLLINASVAAGASATPGVLSADMRALLQPSAGPPSACETIQGAANICRQGWQETPIDASRREPQCGTMNCWMHDDSVRDRLEMDDTKINHITRLTGAASGEGLPKEDGQYIYVYRKDGTISLRPYDREETDRRWMYPGNCRQGPMDNQHDCGGKPGRYLHVRHSQLNGGWSPVWCAGELRIENGRVCMANNESGHFKPNASCLLYLKVTLQNWGIRIARGAVFAHYEKNSAKHPCRK